MSTRVGSESIVVTLGIGKLNDEVDAIIFVFLSCLDRPVLTVFFGYNFPPHFLDKNYGGVILQILLGKILKLLRN